MVEYYKTKFNYYYKKYKNGKKIRVSKDEYIKKTKGNIQFGGNTYIEKFEITDIEKVFPKAKDTIKKFTYEIKTEENSKPNGCGNVLIDLTTSIITYENPEKIKNGNSKLFIIYRNNVISHIHLLTLFPTIEKQGIGTWMLKTILNYALYYGYINKENEISIDTHNLAKPYFEKIGFELSSSRGNNPTFPYIMTADVDTILEN